MEPRYVGAVSGISLTSANIANAMGVAAGSVLFLRWLNYDGLDQSRVPPYTAMGRKLGSVSQGIPVFLVEYRRADRDCNRGFVDARHRQAARFLVDLDNIHPARAIQKADVENWLTKII